MQFPELEISVNTDNFSEKEKEQAVIKFLKSRYLTLAELQSIFTELQIPGRTALLKYMPTPYRFFYGDNSRKSDKAIQKVAEHIDFDTLIDLYVRFKAGYTFNTISNAFDSNSVSPEFEIDLKAIYR